MASVNATDTFYQPYYNLNDVWKDAVSFGFYDDDPFEYSGTTYRDAFEIAFADEGSYLLLQLTGRRITAESSEQWSADNEMTGGKIQGMHLSFDSGGERIDLWSIQDFEVSAKDVNDAMKTKRTGDDARIFKAIFAGNDTFDLSRYDDAAIGYAGADTMLGRAGDDTLLGAGGNDTISGGKGADTIEGGKGKDVLSGDKGADTFLFSVGDDIDIIKDFADDTDRLVLDSDLWNNDLTRRKVVNKFAEEKSGKVVFDFGDETLVLRGIDDKTDLIDDITIA
ncbi:calcium-binding protein [Tropicimonas aquimaris]|uniref:Calcium-binding protein n=1 Tax=Tropicimonas aquimaris TaxID=914152 RepID=A0ABW3ILE8_9RHOB